MTDRLRRPAGRLRAALAASLLAATAALAQPSVANPATAEMTTLAVFHACNANRGCELWITNGTRPGTRLLRDIAPGAVSSSPQNLTALGDGRVVFGAHRPPGHTGFDRHPWITDGTRAGTRLIRRTSSLGTEMAPYAFTPLGDGRAVFVARGDGGANNQLTLWVTGGVRAGTRPLLTLDHWPGLFVPLGNGRALFSYQSDAEGAEMWVTNGRPAGTRLLRDINPGTASSSTNAAAALGDGRVLFNAADGTHGRELWITDGTPRGTRMVADLQPGDMSSDPQMFTPIGGGRALFTAVLHGIGRRLWITDGTAAGTRMLNLPFNPPYMAHLGDGRVVFTGYVDYPTGFQLHITDGTEEGTRMVRVIREGGAEMRHFEPLGDGRAVFWQLRTAGTPHELWVTDGTRAGTRMIGDAGDLNINLGSGLRALGDGRALFPRQDHRGIEPWITDGTRAGTRLLRDIRRGGSASHSNPRDFTLLGSLPADHALVRALAEAVDDAADD